MKSTHSDGITEAGDSWTDLHEAAVRELELIDAAEEVVQRWPRERETDRGSRATALLKLMAKLGSDELRELVDETWESYGEDLDVHLRQLGWLLRRVGRDDVWRAYFCYAKPDHSEPGDELRFLLEGKDVEL